MKKIILKAAGVVALAAMMLYNIQLFKTESSGNVDVTLLGLKNSATAAALDGPLCQGSGGSYCCKNTEQTSCAAGSECGNCQ